MLEDLKKSLSDSILNSLTDVDSIIYRQNVLKDCLKNNSAIKDVYNIASNTLKEAAYYRQSTQPGFSKMVSVSYKVRNSAGLLELLAVNLERLRSLTRVTEKNFNSKGMQKFCGQQSELLTDEFFTKIKQHIEDLKFISEGGNIVLGSGIGNGMKGTRHILRKISCRTIKSSAGKKPGRMVACNEILLDNISIANSAKEMEDAGLVHILRLINHFNDNILVYFELLRHEAGFYFACTNLYSMLEKLNMLAAFPIPYESSKRDLVFKELFDLSLFINEKRKAVYLRAERNDNGSRTFFIRAGKPLLTSFAGDIFSSEIGDALQ